MIESEEAVPWTLDGEFGGDQTHVEIDNLHEAMNLYLTSSKKQKKRPAEPENAGDQGDYPEERRMIRVSEDKVIIQR